MTGIFKASGLLVPTQGPSHLRLRFSLPEDCPRLEIAYAYSPKSLDDEVAARELILAAMERYEGPGAQTEQWRGRLPLQNLVTLSLDSPEGFRGAAHRHASRQAIFLDPHKATPGFIPGPLVEGLWTITLSAHVVLSPQCMYSVEVRA